MHAHDCQAYEEDKVPSGSSWWPRSCLRKLYVPIVWHVLGCSKDVSLHLICKFVVCARPHLLILIVQLFDELRRYRSLREGGGSHRSAAWSR